MRLQKVTEGVTQSGMKGLFTNGMLSWGFQPDGTFSRLDRRSWFSLSWQEKKLAANRLGFELIGEERHG